MAAVLNLDKQMVSQRLLDSSIELFFTFNEPISVHVLASSTDRILSDLCDKQKVSIFEDNLIVPECKKEYLTAKRSAYNFMKHADIDPYFNHDFKPKANEFIIFMCLLRFKKLWQYESETMKLFFCYFLIEYAHLFPQEIQDLKMEHIPLSNEDTVRELIWRERDNFLRTSVLHSIPLL